jgi:hypothetical protein
MGDLPKPSDDAAFTEVERTFFAGAPPEMSEPAGEPPRLDEVFPVLARKRPRRVLFARLRSAVVAAGRGTTRVVRLGPAVAAAAWSGTTRVLSAAGARARNQARASAAALVAMLSVWRIDLRRVAFASVGVVAGLSVGIIAAHTYVSMRVATTQTEAPLLGPPVALAAPVAPVAAATPTAPVAQAAPVAVSSTRAAPQSRVLRKPAPAFASMKHPTPHAATRPTQHPTQRPLMAAAFEDRESYWARQGRSAAPVPASRSVFSR